MKDVNRDVSSQRRGAGIAFIFVSLLVDVLSIGLIIPVLPHLIEAFLGGNVPQAAIWYGWTQVVFLGMQFIAMPIQGALSDRFGRRFIILLSNLGLAIDYLIMAVATTLPLLIAARVISGVMSANLSAANAYIADITPPENRAQAFGIVGSAFGVGLTIAPLIGGVLGSIDIRFPFWVAATLCFANACYGFFVLPESLSPEKRTKSFVWAHANPFGSLKMLYRYPQVLGMVAVVALDTLAHAAAPTTFVLYAGYRFGWGPLMVGITLAVSGVLQSVVQGLLIKPVIRGFGERLALIGALMCGTSGLFLCGVAPSGYWFWAVLPITALWGVARPAAQALLSQAVDPREQGRLQGAVTSVSSVSGIVGAIMFPAILALVTKSHPSDLLAGSTFFVAALIAGMALLLAYYLFARFPKNVR